MFSSQSSPSEQRRHRRLQRLVNREIARWRSGTTPDARTFIDGHPELADEEALLIDLAYEEYVLREQRGQSVDPKRFCLAFPEISRQLRRLLFVDFVFDDSSVFQESPDETIDWPQPGQTFHGLRIISELGRGGFSRVYLAQESSVGDRLLAVKVCLRGGREAFTLGSLDHPHIVPVHSVHEDDAGVTRICMPFLGRATLADIIAHTNEASQRQSATTILQTVARVNDQDHDRDLDPKELAGFERLDYVEGVLRIVEGIAEALCYLHSRGVRHQDLKPSNVLVTRDGVPRLLDFNLAIESANPMRQVGGTLPYMSPEQLKLATGLAKPGTRLDERSDIFSFGLLMFELFTGTLPEGWVYSHAKGLSRRDHAEELIELRHRRPAIQWPETALCGFGMQTLIANCLAENADDRPSSMEQVLKAIRAERKLPTRILRAIHSRPRTTSTAIIAVILATFAFIAFSRAREPQHERRLAQALTAFEANEHRQSVALLNGILADRPRLRRALKLRLRANLELAEYDFAMRDAKLLYQESDEATFYAVRGYINQEIGLQVRSLEDYQTAIRMGCRKAWVYNNLARAEESPQRAWQAIEFAFELQPKDLTIARNRIRLAAKRCRLSRLSHPAFPVLLAEFEMLGGQAAESDCVADGLCVHRITVDDGRLEQSLTNVCLYQRGRRLSDIAVVPPEID